MSLSLSAPVSTSCDQLAQKSVSVRGEQSPLDMSQSESNVWLSESSLWKLSCSVNWSPTQWPVYSQWTQRRWDCGWDTAGCVIKVFDSLTFQLPTSTPPITLFHPQVLHPLFCFFLGADDGPCNICLLFVFFTFCHLMVVGKQLLGALLPPAGLDAGLVYSCRCFNGSLVCSVGVTSHESVVCRVSESVRILTVV